MTTDGAVARIVLASESPRRRDLLAQLGLVFEVMPADIDETPREGEDPERYVGRLAVHKASVPIVGPDVLVIAADTTVALDGEILGKPDDADHARRMLASLSGRRHMVHTGLALRFGNRTEAAVVTSDVTMCTLSPALIEWYIATGEPFGKAGAYALQGAGGVLVDQVHGSVNAIIGLPTAVMVTLAESLGLTLLSA